MSNPASHFARQHEAQRRVVTDDRECIECGYQLRTLTIGSKCPECGTVIEPPLLRDDPLSRMPWRVLKQFLAGAWLAMGCIVLVIIGTWATILEWISWEVLSLIMPLLIGPWIAAMWMLSPAFTFPEARTRGFWPRSRLRRIARWGQMGWAVAAAAFLMINVSNPPAAIAATVEFVLLAGVILGLAGTIVMAILLENLSEWTRDTTAQSVFNWFEWLAPISFGLWLIVGAHSLASILTYGALMVSLGLFPIGILLLARSITVSWQHHIENEMREERRAERSRRDALRAAARLSRVGDPAAEAPANGGASAGRRGPVHPDRG